MPAPLLPPPLPPPRVGLPSSARARWGVGVSLLLHALILVLAVDFTRGDNLWDELARPDSAPPRGGGGGRREVMVQLPAWNPPAPPPAPVRTPPVRATPPVTITRQVPPPLPPAPAPVPPPDSVPRPPGSGAEAGSGGGSGGGAGSGTGPGTGTGAGPGSGVAAEDTARGRARPPESTRLILPPFDYPRSMRGQSVDVNFFVLADGRVDRVVFIPEIADRGYSRKLEEAMKAYRFRPARDASGQAIAGIAIVRLTF